MAASLSASISSRFQASLTEALDTGTRAFPSDQTKSVDWTSGTGASQVDKVFTDTRTLAASATEDLDLAGSLTDAFGGTITFAKIKAIRISAAAGNTNDVQLTRPAANGVPLFLAASDGIAIKPGGVFLWHVGAGAGITVTAATGDLLTLTNSAGGTSVDYTIEILGTSA